MNNSKHILSCVLLFIAFHFAGANSNINAKEISQTNTLNSFMLQMETSSVPSKLKSKLSKIAKKSKDESLRLKALGLLALFEAETKNTPLKSFALIAPYVLSDKDALLYSKQKKHVLIPTPDKWILCKEVKIKNEKIKVPPEIFVYAAQILLKNNQCSDALEAFNTVGSQLNGIPRVLAAEGLGDMHFKLKRWYDSVDSYTLALNVIKFLKTKSEFNSNNNLKNELAALEERINSKLANAKEKLDEELYGPGFVAYRNARRAELSGDCRQAIVLYNSITTKFPDTVYSEASELYQSKCLLKLAKDTKGQNAKRTNMLFENVISKLRKKISSKLNKAIPRVKKSGEEKLKKLQERFDKQKNLPYGKKAAKLAVANLEKFIKKNKFGLYRGEAMLILAEYFLREKLDPNKTSSIMNNTVKWFSESEKLDDTIRKFKVPFKAQSVSAPPHEVFVRDSFGNINKPTIKPEMIINRNTSSWYLDSLKTRLYGIKGFLAFYNENKNEALENYKIMAKFDRLGKIYNGDGDWNNYDRLVWGARHGFFHAQPSELKQLKGKARFAVLVGDFYYITMQFEKSGEVFNKILTGKYCPLSPNLKAYSIYMSGLTDYENGNIKKAIQKWIQAADKAKISYTKERALYTAGNACLGHLGQNSSKKEIVKYQKTGEKLLGDLAIRAKHKVWKNRAIVAKAFFYAKIESLDMAEKTLNLMKIETKKDETLLQSAKMCIGLK